MNWGDWLVGFTFGAAAGYGLALLVQWCQSRKRGEDDDDEHTYL